jgi:hypothetical protein
MAPKAKVDPEAMAPSLQQQKLLEESRRLKKKAVDTGVS